MMEINDDVDDDILHRPKSVSWEGAHLLRGFEPPEVRPNQANMHIYSPSWPNNRLHWQPASTLIRAYEHAVSFWNLFSGRNHRHYSL